MQTAAEALSLVERAPFTETIYSLYVTDQKRHLTGILSLRIVTADPSKPIGDVMTKDVLIFLQTLIKKTSQEQYKDRIFSSPSC